MAINLYKKSFLTLKDFSKEEILYLIDLAFKLKLEKKSNVYNHRLKNKNIAMIFEKASTRTRCAVSVACFDEGAHAEFLGINDIQIGKKESIEDTARVLGRMFDAILFRGFKQETLEKLYKFYGIPVINALTDQYHPTQIIADLMTIKEYYNRLNKLKIVFIGDGNNNVSNSLLIGASKIGLNITIAAPRDLWPDKDLFDYAAKIAKKDIQKINTTEDPYEAIYGADVIYTDVWLSMGEENNQAIKEKISLLTPYKVNKKIMKATGKDSTIFLHCLPASHDGKKHHMEVTEDVFESEQSYVFQQAENRLHTIKAILVATLGEAL